MMYKLVSVFLFCVFLCSSASKNKKVKPNIILILSDDQGWGDLSINGNTNLHTPHIDHLAKNGVSFDRFYVSPVCSPTRAELLTGRYHPRCGVLSTSEGGERIDLDETTIAEIFKNAGYTTAAYGKWHSGMQPPYHPNARGFDDYYGFCSGHWGNYFSPMLERNGELVKGNGFLADDLTDKAEAFIQINKDKPFFLYLPYNTPHSPMQVPDEYWNKFRNKKLELMHYEPEKEDMEFTRAALAMCENIDWNVGRIMKKIEDLKLDDNTIIIYLSDNGPNGIRWNDGMKGRKGSTDEGGVRSPLFIYWKGVLPAGKKISPIASSIDLLPTLTDLANIKYRPQKTIDGISLKPLLLQKKYTWPDRFVYNYWAGKTSVRSQNYRLDSEGKLFDMVHDPGQQQAVNNKYPAVVERLLSAKQKWEQDVLSELPKTENRTFPVGHKNFSFTQLPARDATPFGNISRSNRHPNDTYFTNWISTSDSITWNVDVLTEGLYNVEIYYTASNGDIGAEFELSFAGVKRTAKILEVFDPPVTGMENDRSVRIESYVKEFKPLQIGPMHLHKGMGPLTLKATKIPGKQVMDFRLMMLRRTSL